MKKGIFNLFILTLIVTINANATIFTSNAGYYSADGGTDCMPGTVTFTNLSMPVGAVSKQISFADGTSTVAFPGSTINHVYAYAGEYDVWVTYLNGSGAPIYYDYCRIELFGQPGPVSTYGVTSACPGDKVRFFVSTGWQPSGSDYTFAWNFGDGTPTETSNHYDVKHEFPTAGTFNITVTATGPCGGPYVSTGTFNVTTSSVLTASDVYMYLGVHDVCPNQQVYISYAEDLTNILVQWGDGTYSTTNEHIHSYTTPGTYYPTITFTNGCGSSISLSDTIHVRTDLTWSSPGMGYIDVYNNSPACPNSTIYFNVWANAVEYNWYTSTGTYISSSSYLEQTFTNLGTDSLYVILTNGCGYDTTVYSIVNIVNSIPVNPYDFDPFISDSVCLGGNFTFTGENFGDPNGDMTWSWDFGDGNTSTSFMGAHVYNTPGSYTVTVTGTNSCGMDTTATLNVVAANGVGPDPNTLFVGVPDGDATCVGDSAFVFGMYYNPGGTYFFDFGDGNTSTYFDTLVVNGISYFYVKHPYNAPGTYTVSVTYTNECSLSITKTTTVSVGTSELPSGGIFYDEDQIICLGDPINFLSFGGSQFQWDFGDGTGTLITTGVFEDVPHVYAEPGAYTVSLITTNGCGNSALSTTNIIVPDNRINITTNTIDAACGQANGKAIAVITGGEMPYNVTWSNGSNEILVDSLYSGIYVCNVTDANGCYNFGIATLSDAEAPAIIVGTVVDVTCNGGNDGAIDINVIGSTPPYSYSWSSGSFNQDLSGLVAGPYEVYVKDANGCISTASITVEEPDAVTVSFISVESACGASTGSLTANANGSTGPFTYVWSTGYSGATLSNIPFGIYEVNVIDSKGCVVTEQATVSEDNGSGGPLIATVNVGDLDCISSGSLIDIEVYFAVGSVTYDWSTGATTEDVTVSSEGSYNVTVTDASGCSAIELFEIDHSSPVGQDICMVTVDSMYSANKIIWEKPVSTNIKAFRIYRESSQAGLYYLIGTVPYDSLSVFTDVVANPTIQAWRYKISVLDFCDAESPLSDAHKTIHLNQNLGLVPGSVNLIWDDYEGFSYATFDILRYTTGSGYVNLGSVSSLNHSYTDPSAPLSDSTLFYIVTLTVSDPCTATRAQNNNTVRSNRTDNTVAPPYIDPNMVHEYGKGIAYANVYPNPANQVLTVEFEVREANDYTIVLTDALGQTVQQTNCGNVTLFCKKEIDLTGLEQGIYLVNLVSKNGTITKRFIKL